MPRALLFSLLVVLLSLPCPAQDKVRKSKYDPPADIPHLESTSPEVRAKIDKSIQVMLDPNAGREAIEAKMELIRIGLPAFPRIVAAMAKIRDTITDVDSDEERIIESTLKLADEALREMDGYLNSHSKPVLRPGSSKKYIAYVLRLHYKRWLTTLKDMPKAPGPFDPSREFDIDEVHAVGVHHGVRGKITVWVTRQGAPLVLVLTAHDPVEWTLKIDSGARVRRVILAGYHKQSLANPPEGIPVTRLCHEEGDTDSFHCHEEPLAGDGFSEIGRPVVKRYRDFAKRIRELTDLEITTFQGRYQRDFFRIR